jgi:hypothetical protein
MIIFHLKNFSICPKLRYRHEGSIFSRICQNKIVVHLIFFIKKPSFCRDKNLLRTGKYASAFTSSLFDFVATGLRTIQFLLVYF